MIKVLYIFGIIIIIILKAGGWGGGGGTLIFSCIRRLGIFLGIQNLEFQYFWGVSGKMNIFGSMKTL